MLSITDIDIVLGRMSFRAFPLHQELLIKLASILVELPQISIPFINTISCLSLLSVLPFLPFFVGSISVLQEHYHHTSSLRNRKLTSPISLASFSLPILPLNPLAVPGNVQLFVSYHHLLTLAPTVCPLNCVALFQ